MHVAARRHWLPTRKGHCGVSGVRHGTPEACASSRAALALVTHEPWRAVRAGRRLDSVMFLGLVQYRGRRTCLHHYYATCLLTPLAIRSWKCNNRTTGRTQTRSRTQRRSHRTQRRSHRTQRRNHRPQRRSQRTQTRSHCTKRRSQRTQTFGTLTSVPCCFTSKVI